jgi:type VI protein secretion system component VasK
MSNDNWHMSKSVPLTLIFGLFVQGAAIVWTVSTMTSDIEVNASKIVEVQQRLGRVEDAVHGQAVSMARIDENIKAIRMSVEKMANEE